MILTMMKSKLHRVTITQANLNYVGSITIDSDLMAAANILPNEQVHVVDNNNGSRLVTYAIPGPAGSGVICLNGSAARLVQPGDIAIIITYANMSDEEAKTFQPTVVMVDGENKVTETFSEKHGDIR
ncbi:MAG: aspartate 1-decarboxylase [Firmicutes bacterium]|nr:aspartate 1-decarboxylase [Bacillota bacterium]MBQ3199692.1 aspartate 1-decarboxylase [Bacillota bacterium]